ncbi:MAG: nucleoside deaminase [Desulfobacterales bacterium]|nr:nucleoside deaminase [Desulfobacterales bacterium]
MNDKFFMKKALEMAQQALDAGEFPVGCVLTCENEIIASGARFATTRGLVNEMDHAEMTALRRLENLGRDLDRSRVVAYSTMEPCLMCFGALILAGVGRIAWAYEDVMGGGTRVDRSAMAPLYRDSEVIVTPRVMREESLALFQKFFENPENDYWIGSLLATYTLEQ